MTKAITKSQAVASDVSALLRARNPLLWIVTREEARVEGYLFEAAAAAGFIARTWDVAQGAANMDGTIYSDQTREPEAMLEAIKNNAEKSYGQERCVWIMRDMHEWLIGPVGITVRRKLRNLVRSLPGVGRSTAQAVVVIAPSGAIPPELEGHTTVIDWPLPDREEVGAMLDRAVASLPEFEKDKDGKDDLSRPIRSVALNGQRDTAIDAAVGLTGEEAQACYAKSFVQLRKIDSATVTREKRRVIARERVLEWFEPLPGGLDAVGGLEELKAWLVSRKAAYSPRARAYGLPAPKGALLVGVPGCGKSLTAKAIATAWGVPLLKVDLGALKSKFVGESEGNLRKAFQVIEAIGRCVVWFDEIEKALAGATGGAADGGVSSDALGSILSWMQDRRGEAFVIATANDFLSLPPELLRKGRFDEMWFIDLPNEDERKAILYAALSANGRAAANIDTNPFKMLSTVATACDGFSGAEIAAIVPDAMFKAFADGEREITTEDLLESASTVVPSTKTSAEKITKLREWAKGRARPATRLVTEGTLSQSKGRVLDL